MTTRTWDNYILESRIEFGMAARNNRGRYAGTKVHRLSTDYIVGLVDATRPEPPRTIAERFVRTGQPQLFSAYPACGVTQGQHAGQPISHLTEADVTCTKCKGYQR